MRRSTTACGFGRRARPASGWYHPHLHGFSKTQVLGGTSAPSIIEGIERADPSLAGLAERVLVIRDQDLVNSGRAAVEIRAGHDQEPARQ